MDNDNFHTLVIRAGESNAETTTNKELTLVPGTSTTSDARLVFEP